MGHCQDDHIKEIIDSFETNGSPYEKWSWDVLKAKYPCVKADPGYVGIYDQNAGILFSDKALKAIWVYNTIFNRDVNKISIIGISRMLVQKLA